jgi:PAS domain-containing protein
MSGSEKLIESQHAEAAFRESEEHYRAVAEAATDVIITIDSDIAYSSSIPPRKGSAVTPSKR